ncbi:MAG: dehydrogenase E1 component subunit alpha/beta [Simkaniaceae bacterium]
MTTEIKKCSLEDKEKRRCLAVLKTLLRTRIADDKLSKMVRQNKGGTFHLSTAGHELIGAVATSFLVKEKDWGLLYYRDRAYAIGMGCSLLDLFGAFLARIGEHHSSSRQMPEHYSDKRLRIPTSSSVVGSQFLQAVGIAKAAQIKQKDEVVYVSGGDGSSSQGDFHEALNMAAIHKLGVIFVIQDNGWAISVPVDDQIAGASLAKRSRGYEGLSVFEIDGTDFEELSSAFSESTQKAKKGQGPSLIVAKVPRIAPHSISDDHCKYKSEDDFREDEKRDPLPRYKKWLIDRDLILESELIDLEAEIKAEVDEAALLADKRPFPDPNDASSFVFMPDEIKAVEGDPLSETPIVMVDALNHALKEEMEKDPNLVVFGQDVAHGKGGVFGVTQSLTAEFGEMRCFNTPLAESTIVGLAIGLAFAGLTPVAEIQFCDYMWTGINQIINELSSICYRSRGEYHCPVVIRMPCGGYIQGGPYHSQSVEAFLAHCPGLKIVIPSNAEDAKRLLKGAIRDPNPVIFLEHKALYRQRLFSARKEPSKEDILPLGKGKIVKQGDDLSVITYGMMTPMVYEVARELEKEGMSIEVIDLRTIIPLDKELIAQSVKKTGKVLIAHEAAQTGGFGAEIAAQISGELFHYLDAPIKRIAAKDCPVPYSKILEDEVLPQKKDLEKAIRKLFNS